MSAVRPGDCNSTSPQANRQTNIADQLLLLEQATKPTTAVVPACAHSFERAQEEDYICSTKCRVAA